MCCGDCNLESIKTGDCVEYKLDQSVKGKVVLVDYEVGTVLFTVNDTAVLMWREYVNKIPCSRLK